MTDEYTKVNTNVVDATTVKFEAPGDQVEGKYIDKKTINGQLGESKLYTFQRSDGTFVTFFGTRVIDDNMVKVPLGAQVKIVYLGKEKSKSSPYSFKNFDVFSKQIKTEEPNVEQTPEQSEEVNPDDIPF